MTPGEFIAKWTGVALNEKQAAQSHFLDLCALFDHPTPTEADPKGEYFAFEKGVTKTGGGDGFADVWKRGHFAWEYKKRKANLDAALLQLTQYAAALEYPPLHVACDLDRFKIVTAWTNTVPETHELALDDLADPDKRAILHAVFHDPERLKPKRTRDAVTREAADKFSTIAFRLQHREPDREAVAHFVNQLVFCFFAEDVRLLPDRLFTKVLKRAGERPERAKDYLDRLFAAMEKAGGEFDLTDIRHFNGGLFDGRGALKLDHTEIGILIAAASLDWSQIDPTIFGTLFERFLDPEKRGQIGAHYTDPDKIMRIVEPVIVRPLSAEWEAARAEIETLMEAAQKKTAKGRARDWRKAADAWRRATAPAEAVRERFLERLRGLSILDPACGSGNFLYLALQAVKDLEQRANLECEALGLAPRAPGVGPEILHGIEINELAAELARTTIWIGDIQWRIRNGVYAHPEPILRKLDTIECRDALVSRGGGGEATPTPDPSPQGGGEQAEAAAASTSSPRGNERSAGEATPTPDPSPQGGGEQAEAAAASTSSPRGGEASAGQPAIHAEAEWPQAEFIIGNPPFLGGKLMRAGLSDDYVDTLFRTFAGRVPPEADLVTYWFEKARAEIAGGRAKRAGLVATNSIRGGANRRVLSRIAEDSPIFEAWSDEPWIVEGAAVRVSMVCFGAGEDEPRLNGLPVAGIYADLTAGETDLTTAKRLSANLGVAFMGDTKGGAFDVPGELARHWLRMPLNPNGRPNSDVLKPWVNGMDVTRRSRDMWIIDFGWEMSEAEAALYEAPFEHASAHVRPSRIAIQERGYARQWWRHERPRPEMWARLIPLDRYVLTPRVSKHRLFAWMPGAVVPDSATIAIARDDDTCFGILHSRFHEAWALRLGTSLEDRPRYTPTTTFETFPFPEGLTPDIPAATYADDPRATAIAEAARRLDELRRAWLNPPDLVRIEPEVVPGYPDRILPVSAEAAVELKKRTLTNLYNQRPHWLAEAHARLDAAVAAAYGWPADIGEEEALARLLALNLERAGAGATQAAREL